MSKGSLLIHFKTSNHVGRLLESKAYPDYIVIAIIEKKTGRGVGIAIPRAEIPSLIEALSSAGSEPAGCEPASPRQGPLERFLEVSESE